MTSRLHLAFLASLVLGTALLTERSAEACGGCFVPPENNTVVTDHRMILSVAQGQSTLYDQIRYKGAPESFAWVLPIAGEAQVGLSADLVFSVLDGMTQVGVVAPPRNCPPPPTCNRVSDNAPQAGGFADASAAPSGGVTVTKQEVIGPYETVQLQATNPQALNEWLATNGFSIPADVKPVVAAYVTEHFNFLAMKLKPGATVQSMRPVRVTTPGSTVTLPLRMVAAGTGAVVGISLWVLGQGRYEATNFPMFTVKADDLAWDWTKNSSNFKEVRAAKAAATNGRGWELESSIGVSTQQLDSAIRSGIVPTPGGFMGPGLPPRNADDDYAAIPPADGKPGKTAAQVRDEDLGVLLGRVVSGAELRTTRMRSDLAHAALTEDLVLAASPDQGLLGTTRQVTRELNEPLCPVYDGCDVVGQAPRSEAAANASGTSDASLRSNCSTSSVSGNATSGGALLAGLGALGLVVGRLRRRRAR